MGSERITFNGVTYYRYPDSPSRSKRVYYQRQGKNLHRAIWMAAHGEIPPGHEIHHADGDPLNNELDNLVLMDISEHRRLSADARRDHTLTCAHCGCTYTGKLTRPGHRTFCGYRCKNNWYYHHAGTGRHPMVCPQCGSNFQGQSKQVCCSRTCSLKFTPRGIAKREA